MPTTLVFPARNEARHVPRLAAFADEVLAAGTVDRVFLLDGGSSDGTPGLSRQHGLEVVEVDPRTAVGKGGAVRAVLAQIGMPLTVLLDADVDGLTRASVARLIAPLLELDEVQLVKGVCPRRTTAGSRAGRVSELIARPALRLVAPELAALRDPLSGQVAFRTAAVRDLPLAAGYGLELAMLLQVVAAYGAAAVAEVELELISHRDKDVDELVPVASDVLHTLLTHLGVPVTLASPTRSDP